MLLWNPFLLHQHEHGRHDGNRRAPPRRVHAVRPPTTRGDPPLRPRSATAHRPACDWPAGSPPRLPSLGSGRLPPIPRVVPHSGRRFATHPTVVSPVPELLSVGRRNRTVFLSWPCEVSQGSDTRVVAVQGEATTRMPPGWTYSYPEATVPFETTTSRSGGSNICGLIVARSRPNRAASDRTKRG
jgi:hypothetical protein